jgi:hypothetical protein
MCCHSNLLVVSGLTHVGLHSGADMGMTNVSWKGMRDISVKYSTQLMGM